jgi:hypothetical protein
MQKRAYGLMEDKYEMGRFDPLYWNGKFPHKSLPALYAVLQAAEQAAKKQRLNLAVSDDRYGEGDTSVADFIAKMKGHYGDAPEAAYLDDAGAPYPYFYTLRPQRRLLGLLSGKMDYKQPNPISQAVDDYTAGHEKPTETTMDTKQAKWVEGFMDQCVAAGVPLERVPELMKAAALNALQQDGNFRAGFEAVMQKAGMLPALAAGGLKGIQQGAAALGRATSNIPTPTAGQVGRGALAVGSTIPGMAPVAHALRRFMASRSAPSAAAAPGLGQAASPTGAAPASAK